MAAVPSPQQQTMCNQGDQFWTDKEPASDHPSVYGATCLGGSRLGETVRRSGPFVRAAHNEGTHATFKGVVQLSGFVRSQADIDQAVQVAPGIAGAKSVKRDDPVAERIHGRAIWWWKRINSEDLKTLR